MLTFTFDVVAAQQATGSQRVSGDVHIDIDDRVLADAVQAVLERAGREIARTMREGVVEVVAVRV